MSVSIAVGFKTKSKDIAGYIVTGICLGLILSYVAFFLKFSQSQYFTRLTQKVTNMKPVYVLSGFVFRLLVGSLIVLLDDWSYGIIVIFALFLLWNAIVLIKIRPYK